MALPLHLQELTPGECWQLPANVTAGGRLHLLVLGCQWCHCPAAHHPNPLDPRERLEPWLGGAKGSISCKETTTQACVSVKSDLISWPLSWYVTLIWLWQHRDKSANPGWWTSHPHLVSPAVSAGFCLCLSLWDIMQCSYSINWWTVVFLLTVVMAPCLLFTWSADNQFFRWLICCFIDNQTNQLWFPAHWGLQICDWSSFNLKSVRLPVIKLWLFVFKSNTNRTIKARTRTLNPERARLHWYLSGWKSFQAWCRTKVRVCLWKYGRENRSSRHQVQIRDPIPLSRLWWARVKWTFQLDYQNHRRPN